MQNAYWVIRATSGYRHLILGQKIIHPDDLESSQKEGREIFERGDLSAAIQFRCIAKDGRIVPIEAQ